MEKINMADIKTTFVDRGGVRVAWVDVAKGLGLILVIYGHLLYSGTWSYVNRAIYSFHMPMYFILSGYVAHERRMDRVPYYKRKSYELLLPAIIFILVYIPSLDSFHIITIIKELTFWNGKIQNAPVWFLIVLFQVYIIFDIVNLLKKSIGKKIIFSIVLLGIGYLIYEKVIWFPFGFQKTIVALGFYVIGNIFKEFEKNLTRMMKCVIVISSGILWFCTGVVLNSKISMYSFDFGNYWYFILSAISGSIVWFAISYSLRNIIIFQKWGQNTILVVCTHYIGVFVCRRIANILQIEGTVYFDVLALIVSVVAMFIYMPVCDWINRHMPILVGKKREKKICKKLY